MPGKGMTWATPKANFLFWGAGLNRTEHREWQVHSAPEGRKDSYEQDDRALLKLSPAHFKDEGRLCSGPITDRIRKGRPWDTPSFSLNNFVTLGPLPDFSHLQLPHLWNNRGCKMLNYVPFTPLNPNLTLKFCLGWPCMKVLIMLHISTLSLVLLSRWKLVGTWAGETITGTELPTFSKICLHSPTHRAVSWPPCPEKWERTAEVKLVAVQ